MIDPGMITDLLAKQFCLNVLEYSPCFIEFERPANYSIDNNFSDGLAFTFR